MIDLEKMAKEHEKLFPKATLESQVWKLEEEIKEASATKTYDDNIKEIADIIIVCGGLYRWCPSVAEAVCSFYNDWENYDREILEIEVARKWQINLKRKWAWNGKTYHHVEVA